MLRNLLASSRYLILIAIAGAFFTAFTILVYGAVALVYIIPSLFNYAAFSLEKAKDVAFESIEVIDFFLLGTVLYIVALGLYILFIDENLPRPHWLTVSNLDDLKERLIGVVIVLLAATFLGYVIDWNGNTVILNLGIAVASVLLTLGIFIRQGQSQRRQETYPQEDAEK